MGRRGSRSRATTSSALPPETDIAGLFAERVGHYRATVHRTTEAGPSGTHRRRAGRPRSDAGRDPDRPAGRVAVGPRHRPDHRRPAALVPGPRRARRRDHRLRRGHRRDRHDRPRRRPRPGAPGTHPPARPPRVRRPGGAGRRQRARSAGPPRADPSRRPGSAARPRRATSSSSGSRASTGRASWRSSSSRVSARPPGPPAQPRLR